MNQEPSFSIGGIEIRWWRAALGIVALTGLLVLAWLLGPMTMLQAWLIQRWAAREIWQARDRWASVAGFAWLFGAMGVILVVAIYLPLPVLTPWLASFWERLPSGWDAPLRVVVLRWGILLFLAPLLALLLEWLHPRTVWFPRRLLTEAERLHLQAEAARRQMEATKKQAAAQARAEQAAKRKAPQAAVPLQHTPGTHHQPPAAAHVQLALPIEQPPASMTLDQQAHGLDVEQGAPAADAAQHTGQIHQDQGQPGSAAAAPPAPTPEAPPARPTYDWDHGEGSLQDL